MNETPAVAPVPAAQLARRADLSAIAFETTADLAPIGLPVGQERALDAVRFGARIEHPGFNLFVIGSPGSDMDRTVKAMLEAKARDEPVPPDWVYVHNFAAPQKPRAMRLPPGRGPQFRDAIRDLIKDLEVALPAAFESQDYQARRGAIDEAFRRKQEEAFGALTREAAERSVAVVRTPFGFGIAPLKDGEVLKPELFNALPEEERARVQATLQEFEKRLEEILNMIPRWDKQRRDEIRELNRDTARFAVGHSIDETKTRFTDLPQVLEHLDAMRADLLDNVGAFIAPQQPAEGEGEEEWATTGPLDRYEVNVLVTHPADSPGAPVVEELHPTLGNLVGRIEHEWHRGVMVTSFRRLKAGALHQANGGYLLLDVRSVLIEPFSWLALKRALRSQQIKIERIDDLLGLTTTVSLEPDPIPLDIKVVLYGERLLYYLLAEYDPELAEHFKVLADFEDSFDRGPANEAAYARLIASIAQQGKLRPFDRAAVERVIERASRLAEDAAKLSLRVDPLRDLLAESDYWAGEAGRAVVGAADVERAIAEQIRRASRLRERMLESTLREIALIDTSGRRTGQLNGLSVIELGGYAFGRPSRISARVRPGAGKVVDIEREVALGGPIHAKGVLILAGFLGGRYALDVPLSLHASLVFEQSYSGVEGDSASTAELCALLSALAELPLRQDLALTGSVNQAGEVQAIGGVNEKIEGFFDVCRMRGLTGEQGVLIPEANVKHLMLSEAVIEAVGLGQFHIYPVVTIDQGIEILTGVVAGERTTKGGFTQGSIHARVDLKLREYASTAVAFDRLEREDVL